MHSLDNCEHFRTKIALILENCNLIFNFIFKKPKFGKNFFAKHCYIRPILLQISNNLSVQFLLIVQMTVFMEKPGYCFPFSFEICAEKITKQYFILWGLKVLLRTRPFPNFVFDDFGNGH